MSLLIHSKDKKNRDSFLATSFFFSLAFCQSSKRVLKTIIIDPGHGGLDPGAKGSFSTEADVSLAVSLKLGKAIEQELPETKIIYTRTTDILPGNKSNKTDALRYRADLANSSGGDLFIAIHCNAAPPIRHSEITGYKTVTVRRKKKKSPKDSLNTGIGQLLILLTALRPIFGRWTKVMQK